MSFQKPIFKNKWKHTGNSKHPLYATWVNMLHRCYCEKNKSYKNYGGRGIIVDESWWEFENFIKDMPEKPSKNHSMDRINNDAGYSKDNCRWATRSEQCDNRRLFKNNTSGGQGIVKTSFGYSSRYDYEKKRFQIGIFLTYEEAVEARKIFVTLFHIDREEAIKSISEETVWNNSITKIRGVVPHESGRYVVRATVDGKRYYVGYTQTPEEGELLRKKFIDDYKNDKELAVSKLKIKKTRITSKTKSVGITPSRNGFIARATIGSKRCYVGFFKTLEEAIDARLKYIKERTI